MPAKRPPKRKGGRQAEVLKVEGDWRDAVSRAMKKGKPPARVKKPKKKGK